jgi:hypothetical protein
MATGHDDSKHLLVAYSVVLLCWRHAPEPEGNWVPIALTGGSPDARGGITGIVLLLRGNASYGKTRGVHLETDWLSRIEMRKHQGLRKDVAELCERLDHGWSG